MTKRVVIAVSTAAIILVLIVVFATGAGGGRPSVAEVADGLQGSMGESLGGDVTDEMATCIAEALHASDISDDALQAVADGDQDYRASDADAEALAEVSTKSVSTCATPEVPDAE